jgi:hypothetical protein
VGPNRSKQGVPGNASGEDARQRADRFPCSQPGAARALAGLGFALLRHLNRSRWTLMASWLLVAAAVAGVLLVTWFSPNDQKGRSTTTTEASCF